MVNKTNRTLTVPIKFKRWLCFRLLIHLDIQLIQGQLSGPAISFRDIPLLFRFGSTIVYVLIGKKLNHAHSFPYKPSKGPLLYHS